MEVCYEQQSFLSPDRHHRNTKQHIKEGKHAYHWTRLSCRRFRNNEVQLQLHALAYNLAVFLRCINMLEAMADWSLTRLQLKLIKIGVPIVCHASAITFQPAKVAVTGPMVRAIHGRCCAGDQDTGQN